MLNDEIKKTVIQRIGVKKVRKLEPRLREEPRKTTEGSPERAPRHPGGCGVKVESKKAAVIIR
jgi:hypothetical protein